MARVQTTQQSGRARSSSVARARVRARAPAGACTRPGGLPPRSGGSRRCPSLARGGRGGVRASAPRSLTRRGGTEQQQARGARHAPEAPDSCSATCGMVVLQNSSCGEEASARTAAFRRERAQPKPRCACHATCARARAPLAARLLMEQLRHRRGDDGQVGVHAGVDVHHHAQELLRKRNGTRFRAKRSSACFQRRQPAAQRARAKTARVRASAGAAHTAGRAACARSVPLTRVAPWLLA
jgi:hypothetical protein